MCRHRAPQVFHCALIALLFCFAAQGTSARAEDLLSAALRRDESFDRGSLEARAEVWVPGPDRFGMNHRVSPAASGELTVRVLSRNEHNLFVVAQAMYSPQQLRAHLVEAETTLYVGGLGVRYMPAMLCSNDHVACPFVEAALGLTWESAPREAGHDSPRGDLTITGGVGYRFRLARHFGLGVRADLAYAEESGARHLGWVTLGGFASALF